MFRVFRVIVLFFVCAQLCHCVRAFPAALLTLARFTVRYCRGVLFPQLLKGRRPKEVPCSQAKAEQWAVYGWARPALKVDPPSRYHQHQQTAHQTSPSIPSQNNRYPSYD